MIYLTVNDQISILPFSIRLYNGLYRAGINTIGDILDYSQKYSWSNIHALGEKTIIEINGWLRVLKKGSDDYALVSDAERSYHLLKATIPELLQYIPVRETSLSTQAKNSLLESRLINLAQVSKLSEEDLLSLKRMGKKTAKEILDFCSELNDVRHVNELLVTYTAIDPLDMESSEAYLASKEKANRLAQWDGLTRELVNSWGGTKDTYIQILTEIFEKHPDAQGETVYYLMYDEPQIRDQAKAIVLKMIEKRMEGISRERIERSMPDHLKNTTIPDEILVNLENEGKIISDEDILYCVYPSFGQILSTFDSEKDQKAVVYMKMRLEGKTLAEIGDQFGMSRERIRQVTTKFMKRIQDCQQKGQLPCYFAEDRYRYVYEQYVIACDDFVIAFNELPTTYNYLTIIGENSNETKIPLSSALEDENISVEMRRQLEWIVYKDYVYIDGTRIKKDRQDLALHYIKTRCRDITTVDDFMNGYHEWLAQNNLTDEELIVIEGTYINKVSQLDCVLWNQGKRFRYYQIQGRDYNDLMGCVDFEQFANKKFSTLKLFKDYPEIMQEYDIRDEYELHNLLRKIWPSDDQRISFQRMPTIEIGKGDREEQLLSLLLQYAPVSAVELAQRYEEEYGDRATTILAGLFRKIDDYYYDGMYTIDAENLPFDQFSRMQQILEKDCYAISDIKRLFLREFPDESPEQINPYTLKTLGFHIYSGYVISKKYSSATDYFNHILTSEPLVDGRNLNKWYYEYSAFTQEAARLKRNWEIVEFAPKQYIHIGRLNENGITAEQLQDYGKSVNNFVEAGSFFTVFSLQRTGFSHPLDELGFDEWFYSSILLEDRDHFSYQRIGGTRLFYAGESTTLFVDFLNWILNQLTKIDIYDLRDMLEKQYGIVLSKDKLIEIVRNTDLYYDIIMETVYVDYDTYFEEV